MCLSCSLHAKFKSKELFPTLEIVPLLRYIFQEDPVVVDWTNDIVTLFLGQIWSQPGTGVSRDTPSAGAAHHSLEWQPQEDGPRHRSLSKPSIPTGEIPNIRTFEYKA